MGAWLITGCSSGLGNSLARAALEAGHAVVVTARDPRTCAALVAEYPETAVAAALDVRDKGHVRAAVELAEARFGGVDVLVNNAGYGYRAAVEEAPDRDVADLFATNFFGTVAMIQAVLPGMRSRRRGTIINVSSMGGRRAMAGSGFYSATKFALGGLSDALRKEVEPLGIRVMVVEPGAFRTDFAGRSLQQSAAPIADYADTAGLRRKENSRVHGHQPGDPDRAARTLVQLVGDAALPFRLLLGSDAVAFVGAELDAQQREIAAWKAVSESTDYPSRK